MASSSTSSVVPVAVAVDGRSSTPLQYALSHTSADTPLQLLCATPSAAPTHANPFVLDNDRKCSADVAADRVTSDKTNVDIDCVRQWAMMQVNSACLARRTVWWQLVG